MKTFLLLCNCLILVQGFAQKKTKQEKFNYLSNCLPIETINMLPNKLEQAYHLFMGEFDNLEQAKYNEEIEAQEIIKVPIWQKRKNEYWGIYNVYLAGKIEKPVHQFIFKFVKYQRDTFLLECYIVPESMPQNSWAKPNNWDNYKPKDLIKMDCVHYIINNGNDFYFYFDIQSQPCFGAIRLLGESLSFTLEGKIASIWSINKTTYYKSNSIIAKNYKQNPLMYVRGDVKNPKYKTFFNLQK